MIKSKTKYASGELFPSLELTEALCSLLPSHLTSIYRMELTPLCVLFLLVNSQDQCAVRTLTLSLQVPADKCSRYNSILQNLLLFLPTLFSGSPSTESLPEYFLPLNFLIPRNATLSSALLRPPHTEFDLTWIIKTSLLKIQLLMNEPVRFFRGTVRAFLKFQLPG